MNQTIESASLIGHINHQGFRIEDVGLINETSGKFTCSKSRPLELKVGRECSYFGHIVSITTLPEKYVIVLLNERIIILKGKEFTSE